MTTMNLIAQLDQMISGLEQKKQAVEALLQRFRDFRASLDGMPPEFLSLLTVPEDMQSATPSLDVPVSVGRRSTQAAQDSASPNGPAGSPEESPSTEEGEEGNEGVEDESSHPESADDDKGGRTITEWAVKILSERPDLPMHYRMVANVAIERGYSSARSTSKKTVHRSFWAMMNRNPELFEARGGGYYVLRDQERKK